MFNTLGWFLADVVTGLDKNAFKRTGLLKFEILNEYDPEPPIEMQLIPTQLYMRHAILDVHVVAINQPVTIKTLFQQNQTTLMTYDKFYVRKFTDQSFDLKLNKPYNQDAHILMWYTYHKHVYVIDEIGNVKRFSQRKSPQIIEKLLTHYYA